MGLFYACFLRTFALRGDIFVFKGHRPPYHPPTSPTPLSNPLTSSRRLASKTLLRGCLRGLLRGFSALIFALDFALDFALLFAFDYINIKDTDKQDIKLEIFCVVVSAVCYVIKLSCKDNHYKVEKSLVGINY